jgi:hypothetical protein
LKALGQTTITVTFLKQQKYVEEYLKAISQNIE